MYHVVGTGLVAIFLYLISYFFYRIGFFSLQFHRKIWNSLLGTAFLLTALAGIFMALQINFKWDIPFIKTILKWHVEFGIGLAFAGMFHLIWHLSYFSNIFKSQDSSPEISSLQKLTPEAAGINLFIVGFVSSSIQLLLIREMMNISGGYELIAGIFLGSWLITSALGASIAGKSRLNDIKRINIIFSVSPLISLFLLLLLSKLFLNSGETPSVLVSIIFTFLILIPFCMVSGFTFVKLISIARQNNDFVPGKSFSIETTGGITSGILISLLTSGLLNTYQILLLISLLSTAYTILTFFITNSKSKSTVKIVVTVLASCIIILNPDVFFRQILLKGIKVTYSKDTPYGNITQGKYHNEKSLYYNQRLLSYNDDVIEREENIHYAMLQREFSEKVILVSGSLHSNLPEILKYPVKKIIYIERDPELAKSGILPGNVFPAECIISNNDAFRYIRNSKETFDVIILLIPPPSTLLLNRYYTTDFFYEARKRLNNGGVFVCSPGPGDDYFNKESINMYSSIFNSLAAIFKNVEPVVGNKLYFIASDSSLSLSFCQMTKTKNITNSYVNSDYLADDLIAKKSEEVKALLNREAKQNRAAFPVACFHFQKYNFSKNMDEKIPSIILIIIAFALPVMTIKRRNLVMYFSASALAGYEIIMLLIIQLIMGNMYQITGLLIAGLMAGLAVGAGAEIKLLNSFSTGIKGICLMLFYIGIGLSFNNILELKNEVSAVGLIILSSFLPALLTGNLFRELTINIKGSASSEIYSADLAGSAFGFIFISGIIIPSFGIKVTIMLLSTLIFAGFLFGTIKNKK
ncbi:MAG: hypothetical protein LLG13_14240 [Bacteroidales bacterium]|nr:hypothetical protein [Bacteroidales bacterium]